VLLFAGIGGQGGILGAGLLAFAQGIPPGRPALLLDLAFGGSATYFAAFAMTRAILAQRVANELGSPLSTSAAGTDRFETFSSPDARDSRWSLIVLTVCGAAIGLGGGALMLAPRQISGTGMSPIILAGGNIVATVIGCLPAFAGVFVGWGQARLGQARPEQARQEQATDLEPEFEGLLTRLGRNRFYCDPLLFVLLALPVRAAAQFARFVDWFFIDGFVSGAPASAVEAAGLMLEPVQGRSVVFYLASAVVGTALLAAVVISLRY
jgi:NADH:ubiquinone oxidoreductase subunit 5 (subunit L)/multisubunit Na+/H+ antiporter MnhA subunit